MSKNYDKFKAYYEQGLWDKRKLHDIVSKGALTPEEYRQITGEEYEV